MIGTKGLEKRLKELMERRRTREKMLGWRNTKEEGWREGRHDLREERECTKRKE